MTLAGFKTTLAYTFPEMEAEVTATPSGVAIAILHLGEYQYDAVVREVQEKILPLPLTATFTLSFPPVTSIENLWVWYWDEWTPASNLAMECTGQWWISRDWGFKVRTTSPALCVQEEQPDGPPPIDDVWYDFDRNFVVVPGDSK